MSDDPRAAPDGVRIDVTLPCDPRFRAMLDPVAAGLAACIGPAASDAAVRVVTLAADGVLDHAAGSDVTSIGMTFTAVAGKLTIQVRYDVAAPAGATSGSAIERMLSTAGGGDAPLVALRRLASRVEIGRVGGAACCTLVLPLPAAVR